MTENLTDAELDTLEAEHENCCVALPVTRPEGLPWHVAECLKCDVDWPCPTVRALAELREWRAQFGPDPSRWHKVWEVGPIECPRCGSTASGAEGYGTHACVRPDR